MQTQQTNEFICDKAFTADNNFFQLTYFAPNVYVRVRACVCVCVCDERIILNNVNESHWMKSAELKTVHGELRNRRLTPRVSMAIILLVCRVLAAGAAHTPSYVCCMLCSRTTTTSNLPNICMLNMHKQNLYRKQGFPYTICHLLMPCRRFPYHLIFARIKFVERTQKRKERTFIPQNIFGLIRWREKAEFSNRLSALCSVTFRLEWNAFETVSDAELRRK